MLLHIHIGYQDKFVPAVSYIYVLQASVKTTPQQNDSWQQNFKFRTWNKELEYNGKTRSKQIIA